MDVFLTSLTDIVAGHLELQPEQVAEWMETPPRPELGDYAFPCFRLARIMRKSPMQIAAQLHDELSPALAAAGLFEPPRAEGPYLNVTVRGDRLAEHVVGAALKETHGFGPHAGRRQTVLAEYSSPNIARPLSIGHLRSTVLGNCLSRLYRYLGYKVVSINYLGDWGTQFGKLLVAYRRWFDGTVEDVTVPVLFDLYVRFHREAERAPALEDEARDAFRRLEAGDEESHRLWKRFREVSLAGMQPLYDLLGVQFEDISGESFYNELSKDMIEAAISAGLAEESDGALIVRTEQKNLGPFQLRKSDGSTLYSTRDLAALFHRLERYDPVKILYIVGSEQRDHFRKLFEVARKMGLPEQVEAVHVPFGLIRIGMLKISTRAGRVLFMEDVLTRAIELARTLVDEKNPDLEDKEEVARAVGVGAVIFGDLLNDREKNIDFDWDAILSFEGETGPYVQYSHARACSVLSKANRRKAGESPESGEPARSEAACARLLTDDEEQVLLRALHGFPGAVEAAAENCRPSQLAQCLIIIARMFNRFYHNCPVIQAGGDRREARLLLTRAVKDVLHRGLSLLGIEAPASM